MLISLFLTISVFSLRADSKYLDISEKYPGIQLRSEIREELKLPEKQLVKPVATRPAYQTIAPQELQPLFTRYAQEYGVDADILAKIARCESHFNPQAVSGPYGGMYQYLVSTWASTRNAMGQDPNPDLRFSPEEAIETSAFKISRGGIGAWPVCGR